MNEIRVSFDQQAAVRISDGLRLAAAPWHVGVTSRCGGCAAWAVDDGSGFPSCYDDQCRERQCSNRQRRDARDIVWRPT